MENGKLKELEIKMTNHGWDCMKDGLYPRPYLWDWLEITHPELVEEFKKWFDEKVRC